MIRHPDAKHKDKSVRRYQQADAFGRQVTYLVEPQVFDFAFHIRVKIGTNKAHLEV